MRLVQRRIVGACALTAIFTLGVTETATSAAKRPVAIAPAPLSSVTEAAVVVSNFDEDLTRRFRFDRTIGAILASAPTVPNKPVSRAAFVQTLLNTFNSTQRANPMSGLPVPVQSRQNEAGLTAARLLDPASGMVPIGLFSRFDLAPKDWSDCGEHRIVYSLKNASFFLIFEAKMPNPNPSEGIRGCRALALRWRAIGATATPISKRNSLLDNMYYAGFGGYRAIVNYHNYGEFLGQVRSNSVVDGPWQLREFRILGIAPKTLAFLAAPVTSNPWAELYQDGSGRQSLEERERSLFHSDFSSKYVAQLREVESSVVSTISDADYEEILLNKLGAAIDFRFNEFQSDADGQADSPKAQAGSAIRNSIPAEWPALPGAVRVISRDSMLNRASAITCGGCHNTAVPSQVGEIVRPSATKPITWPNSLGFTHVAEGAGGQHRLSDALTRVFIPFRRKATLGVINSVVALSPPAKATIAARLQAERLGQSILRGNAANTAEVAAMQTETLRRLSDEARASDIQKEGAFMRFRRPH